VASRVRLYDLILAAALTAPISMSPADAEQPKFPSAGVAPRSSCAGLASLSLPNAKIISATQVSGAINYCAVLGVINQRVSVHDPDRFTYGIGFQANLPNTWIGRFELMGGSGSDGSLRNPTGGAGTELAQGWVVAANDGGHENSLPNPFGWADTDTNAGGTVHFGVDEQAREDYGYNAMGQTAEIAEKIISHYYGWEVQHISGVVRMAAARLWSRLIVTPTCSMASLDSIPDWICRRWPLQERGLPSRWRRSPPELT
jgi:Tannase and feruloyl esterase